MLCSGIAIATASSSNSSKLLDAAYPAHTAIKLILDNHVGDKGGAGVRRDHRLLLAMRFEKVFLASRRLDSVQFDDLLLEQGRLQRARPSGVGERVSAINFASAAPSRKPGKPRPLRRSQPSAAT
jgi:hypothetical protein